jgi:microcompartment protein CcmL/EutN
VNGETGDVRAAVAAGLNTVLAAEGEMLIKWVVIAESMGADGERGLWAMASADMKSWETLGFLEYSKAREYARRVAEQNDDE